jgi:hypothetical protein
MCGRSANQFGDANHGTLPFRTLSSAHTLHWHQLVTSGGVKAPWAFSTSVSLAAHELGVRQTVSRILRVPLR